MDLSEIKTNRQIETIKNWIEKEAPFRGRTEAEFIRNYLNASDNDVEKTKKRILNYYTFRKIYPRIMRNRDFLMQANIDMFDQGIVTVDNAQNDCDLPVVIVVKLSRITSNNNIYDAIGLLILGLETGIMEFSRTRDYGVKFIFDMEDLLLSVMWQCTPTFFMQIGKSAYDALPIKVVEVHAINVGFMSRLAINMCMPFVPEYIKQRLYIHGGSWECLEDHVPARCLPKEYGGSFGTVEKNNEVIRSSYIKWRDYMMDDDQYGFSNDQ